MSEYTAQEKLYLWLHAAARNNILFFEQMLIEFPDLEEAYREASKGNAAAFMKWDASIRKRLFEAVGLLDTRLKWLADNNITPVIYPGENYPALLKEINHPPPVLYVKGCLPKGSQLPIAIVGMRDNTSYGEEIAKHLSSELVKNGAVVVSGMALGIDCYAARGALDVNDAKCPTVAVLGCGVDVIYPSSNASLYYEIIERGGVVSEFLEGTKPYRENFPMRNRVISGLSRGVVVVEAAARSGSAITANYALEQNRDVFAVPGRITDESSIGPNGMIQRGEAKPVFCAADILVEYGYQTQEAKPIRELDISALSLEEKCIVEVLNEGEKSADELCEILSMPTSVINSCLTSLQFSGIIKQLPGRVFGL